MNWISKFFSKLPLELHFQIKLTQQWTGLNWNNFLAYNQLIDDENLNHTTVTLSTALLNTMGGENRYIIFGYDPHMVLKQTQE